MSRTPLIIWRESMPDVEKGIFGYVSEHWENTVKCFYLQKPLKERIDCGWSEQSYAKVEVEIIPENTDPNQFVTKIITMYPDAIHVFFGGLRHSLKRYLDSYINKKGDTKLVIISEKPHLSGNLKLLKKILKKMLYYNIFKKYNKNIDAFLAMGQKGVDRYLEYGYDGKIYPFMYNPEIQTAENKACPKNVIVNEPLRFLYLGRFDFQIKGCKILMNAFDNIKQEYNGKWKLTLVGGYGNEKNKIIKWANEKEFVEFGGKWKQIDIVKNMSNYDICLVPSIEDGWNLCPNYSILANIGIIASDEAISHELVENSKSGIVYHYNDIEALIKHLEYAINNRDEVLKWKLKTFEFSDNISSKSVGDYFIDIMDYTFYNSYITPKCPWLNK